MLETPWRTVEPVYRADPLPDCGLPLRRTDLLTCGVTPVPDLCRSPHRGAARHCEFCSERFPAGRALPVRRCRKSLRKSGIAARGSIFFGDSNFGASGATRWTDGGDIPLRCAGRRSCHRSLQRRRRSWTWPAERPVLAREDRHGEHQRQRSRQKRVYKVPDYAKCWPRSAAAASYILNFIFGWDGGDRKRLRRQAQVPSGTQGAVATQHSHAGERHALYDRCAAEGRFSMTSEIDRWPGRFVTSSLRTERRIHGNDIRRLYRTFTACVHGVSLPCP